jgi:hypothetical protein
VGVGDVGVEFEGFGEGVVGFVFGLVALLLVGVGFGKGGEGVDGELASAWRMR